jgi:precorrin-6B methylase 2
MKKSAKFNPAFFWRWNDMVEWLPIQDAVISHFLAPKNSKILEVGTWKGGWAITMAQNDRSRKIVCVDPFPNLDTIKEQFLANVETRATGQVTLFETLDEALQDSNVKFDLIHIDGEHSQSAVARDLEKSISRLTAEGLLVIDDIFYHSFPGVTAATFSTLEAKRLSPFLFTEKKLYICHKEFYQEYYAKARTVLVAKHIPFEEDQSITQEASSYLQSNSINGFSLLIIPAGTSMTSSFFNSIGVKNKFSMKHFGKQLLPPFLISILKRTKKP